MTLTTSRLIGSGLLFPFSDLSSFINSLSPKKVKICFIQSAHDLIVDLNIEFHGADAKARSFMLKEALIRSEVSLGFECQVLEERNQFPQYDWPFVEIVPDEMSLPSGKKIAFPIPLIGVVRELFKQSQTIGSEISYLVELTHQEPSTETAKLLIPAIAELTGRNGSRNTIHTALLNGFDIIKSGGWSAKEKLCINAKKGSAAESWVETALRHYLRSTFPYLPQDLLKVHWSDTPLDNNVDQLQVLVARLRPQLFLNEIFETLVPSVSPRELTFAAVLQHSSDTPKAIDGRYVFISYAHANATFVKKLSCWLKGAGIAYWLDTQIEVGSRWDEELEDSIKNCGAFIACVSEEYQSSKFCRREIKFADLVNKIILPVSASQWVWGEGLQMMFQELQVSVLKDSNSFNNLKNKLLKSAPQIEAVQNVELTS